MSALSGLVDFISNVWQFILSTVSGIFTMVQALLATLDLAEKAIFWMPAFLASTMTVCLALIVVLRVVGR